MTGLFVCMYILKSEYFKCLVSVREYDSKDIVTSSYQSQRQPSCQKRAQANVLVASSRADNIFQTNRYILACLNPRMFAPSRYESRLSVAKSLAIYFNTLERKFSREFLCVGNTSGLRPNCASADVQSLDSYNLRKLICAKTVPCHCSAVTFTRINCNRLN